MVDIPADKEEYQFEIQPNTLYYVKNQNHGTAERNTVAIEVQGGVVDVYGSMANPTAASAPTGMTLDRAAFEGFDTFAFVPTFIYLDGAPTSIIVSAIEVEEVT